VTDEEIEAYRKRLNELTAKCSEKNPEGKIKGSDTFSLTFMLPYSVLLLLFINSFSLLFLHLGEELSLIYQ